jgi:uncharacterized protein DUF4190
MTVVSPTPSQSTSTQAITSLVLGILSLFCCPLLAPVAWYLGSQEVKAVREGRSAPSGEGIAKAGMILGIIGTIWMVLVGLWIFFWGGMAVLQAIANR